ncbi:unnamed protein product [Chondrus crispus]|uniref:Integrase catalytic domain-containing protein n=1 Tax=Chondrus crispus TaxID=2769 RepID=R7QQY8_CHOCR|nr:unnamed protein product [Chondrus crispus]CDF39896.1 unnamed protein product [Chondrus crispus]|eukprot:XP_005710190.1 unnamed protein product [Chondrus crispus]
MTELGLKVGFENGKCMIRRGSTVVATATLVGELYVLDIVSDIGSAHAATLQTWHESFAHANKIKNTDNDCIPGKCSACVYGKATRSVIPKERSSRRAYFCLDLVHSDVCGPLEVQSIGGAKYFITFIDDHSNWSVVYPMHHKSEAFERYKMFAQLAQTHTGRKIKVLRTDRSGEYLSTEFKSFLIANGTQHQMTTAYTPEQNGVAERLNRTLVNLVRSMLAHKKKLDARAKEAMFLGYAENTKAYKLWDGDLHKVIVSRDVTFDESTGGKSGEPMDTNEEATTDDDTINLNIDEELRKKLFIRQLISVGPLAHAHVTTEIPNSYKQAMDSPKARFWQKGIDKELASQHKNKTWTLVPRSQASNVLTSRWVFAVKQLPDESGKLVETAKGRLVARGFQQVEGIDYTETFAPVIKFTTIRLLLALVAHFDLELHQMDVVTAFLNGELHEEIYMEQPEGCIDKVKPDSVIKNELNKRFDMKDLGEAKTCLGLEIDRIRSKPVLTVTQSKYAQAVLKRFKMSACNPCLTPMEQSRHLSQHCADPHDSHWTGVKRVLRYLRGSQHLGIVFGKDDLGTELHGYSDADWGGCLESRKSTSGYVFKLCDGPISWASRKQTVVAKSTCEAEYIALSEACKEAAWLRRFHADVLGANSDPTIRHIDIMYHFVRDAVQRKLVTLYHCPTTEMPADMLTKPLGRVLFEKFVGTVGLSKCKAAQSM